MRIQIEILGVGLHAALNLGFEENHDISNETGQNLASKYSCRLLSSVAIFIPNFESSRLSAYSQGLYIF